MRITEKLKGLDRKNRKQDRKQLNM
ncbi:uncharacterized protein METZ01_LOCUS102512 [marine metagenome]|uniref:Uncharacterized protein n=1 Tax=marine metagenome TaxID=408172 RepID=A0A381WCA4_9ZZZZ